MDRLRSFSTRDLVRMGVILALPAAVLAGDTLVSSNPGYAEGGSANEPRSAFPAPECSSNADCGYGMSCSSEERICVLNRFGPSATEAFIRPDQEAVCFTGDDCGPGGVCGEDNFCLPGGQR